MCKKVLVLGNERAYVVMYQLRGYTIVDSIEDADIIQFTGGEDVSPVLYGEESHPTTWASYPRDQYEMDIYTKCLDLGKGMVGICRGGQFLNVMSGGRLMQDVDNHALWEGHFAIDMLKGGKVDVTSTHHQMMRAGDKGVVILACPTRCTRKLHMVLGEEIDVIDSERMDTEAVWYEDTKCLCFQPHPEMRDAPHSCVNKFFEFVERYF